MRVDLSGTESGFDVIKSGRYPARVTDGEIRNSGPNAKHPGAEYINWEFTLTEDAGEYATRRLWTNTPLSHGECDCKDWSNTTALIGLKNLLAASGQWSQAEMQSEDFDFEIDDVLGSEVMLTVTIRKYNDEDQNEVKRVKPLTSASSGSATLLP